MSQYHTAPCSFSHNSLPIRLLCPIPRDHPGGWIVMPGSSGTSSYAAPVCWLWNIPVLMNEFRSTSKKNNPDIYLTVTQYLSQDLFPKVSSYVLSAGGLFKNLARWPSISWTRVSHVPVRLFSRFGRMGRRETLGSRLGDPLVACLPRVAIGSLISSFLRDSCRNRSFQMSWFSWHFWWKLAAKCLAQGT